MEKTPERVVVKLSGYIVPNDDKAAYAYFGYECTCPSDITDVLASVGTDVQVQIDINSPGGSVIAASEMYTQIRAHKGDVYITVSGIAASAASVVAMAATCTMSPTAIMMIHNSQCSSYGDYRDMDKTSALLREVNETVVNAYVLKSGQTREKIIELMNADTYMSAQSALALGLIDGVMFSDEQNAPSPTASLGKVCMRLSATSLPHLAAEKIAQVQAFIDAQQPPKADQSDIDIAYKALEIENQRY